MQRLKFILSIGMIAVFFSAFGRDKAVFIIVDGIPADLLEKVSTPAIDEIAGSAGYTRAYLGGEKGAYSESPTISAVGYNTLLTGTWANKHNVWGNDISHPNYHYQTLFRVAKEARPDLKTAIFSTWLDNRTKLVGEGLPETGNFRFDYAFDGFEHDTIAFPHHDPDYIFRIDEHVSKEAGRYIRENGPDLSWVYLQFTDDAGHYYGDSPEMEQAVKNADNQVGRIWEAVKERIQEKGERWMVVVVTDHGRDAETGKNHGGQSDRERTIWISTNYLPLNAHFRQTPAIVDIMPSILRFFQVGLPAPVREEMDGVPFIGDVSLSRLKGVYKDNQIDLSWNVLDPSGDVEVWLATTNHFKEGKTDNYRLVGKTMVSQGHFRLDTSDITADYYKIVLKAPHNWVNYWIVR